MIKSENLTFEYITQDETEATVPRVLDGINVGINAGEFVAILGRNGSGKSTLARHFNALLSPGEGTLWVNGLDTSDPENIWEIRRSAGMVFQNPDNQMIATTVEEDVAFGPENLGIPPEEIRRRVSETLAAVGMSDYAKFAPHHLSGGQKQRVAIAGVLAMQPSCIILDEPSAMLDPSGRREVMETLIRLNRESQITVILITHFMEEAARANRVVVMDAGKIVMDDTPRRIFSQVNELKKLGLGVPQITELAFTLHRRGLNLALDVISTAEIVEQISQNCDVPALRFPAAPTPALQENTAVPVIELRDVSHIYNANSVFEKTALSHINLKIHAGEILAIIGHTGSGKSTLIQHLNALLKPTHGEIFFEGKSIEKATLKDIRHRVGLVFQYPEHQLFEVTVYKDVAFGPTRMGLSSEDIHERVISALETVGLPEEFHEKSPFELSGGQKRRAAIAGVLAMRPQVLVLDEPAAGLDPQGREEIFDQMKKMHQLGITIIFVSHNMDDAARLANRILVMNKGEIALDDTPQKIFSQTRTLTEIGLDIPQISKLMARLHEKNPHVPTHIFTVQEAADLLTKAVQS